MSDITTSSVELEHGKMVARLAKPGADILASLTPEKADLIHMSMGVSGESGELLDAIKKYAIYGKPIDLHNVVEELGDIEFYLARIRQLLDFTRDEILSFNTNKLSNRYGEGKYTDAQAIARADKG